ncbi:hypothetical protein BMS3Bbin02_00329 [bacterium BMS3Bbin02]|nr:hypothetical protein BMS3Bbin02_00329 [bacterium BMS3Bbin02]
MSAANADPLVSTNAPPPPVFEYPNARTRNAAISPRVISASGQYASFAGGLHPLVIPAAARRLISTSNSDPSSSEKKSVEEVGRSNPRPKSAAICPRVTDASGQNRSLAGGLQPLVIP